MVLNQTNQHSSAGARVTAKPAPLKDLLKQGVGVAQSFQFAYATPEAASVTCPTCGEQPTPRPLTQSGMWARGACLCLRENLERQRKNQLAEIRRAVLQERLYQCYSWLGKQWSCEAMGGYVFETFNPLRQPEAWEMTQAWIHNPCGIAVFYGPYGTGKTHLMAAVCNALLASGRKCRWTTATNLFQAVSSEMNATEGDWTRITALAAAADVLLLDDVDKGRPSEFRHDVYHAIFDRRVIEKRPTILSLNEFSRLGEFMSPAVEDRLYSGRIKVEFVGESYRKSLAIS